MGDRKTRPKGEREGRPIGEAAKRSRDRLAAHPTEGRAEELKTRIRDKTRITGGGRAEAEGTRETPPIRT